MTPISIYPTPPTFLPGTVAYLPSAVFTGDLCLWGREVEDVGEGEEWEKQKKKVKEALEETTGPMGKEGSLPWQPCLWGKGRGLRARGLAEAHPEEGPPSLQGLLQQLPSYTPYDGP